jgi:manganese transport protein
MEGFLNFRIRPWLRRIITRLMAVVPAVIVIAAFGENSTGAMLVLSQVILSLQLPFAIIPLVHAVADKKRMGNFSIPMWIQAAAWVTAGIILALNVKLVIDQISTWIADAGANAWVLELTLIPLALAVGALLLYVIVHPWLGARLQRRIGWRGVQ